MGMGASAMSRGFWDALSTEAAVIWDGFVEPTAPVALGSSWVVLRVNVTSTPTPSTNANGSKRSAFLGRRGSVTGMVACDASGSRMLGGGEMTSGSPVSATWAGSLESGGWEAGSSSGRSPFNPEDRIRFVRRSTDVRARRRAKGRRAMASSAVF
jgi:hypothetical protein